MKTEKFEDIVKQKLESIAPEFQESDWGAFQKYSSQHTGTLENIFLKSKIFKTAAVLLIGSVMALAVNMYFENKVLKEDIAKIKEELAQNRVHTVERQVSENQENNNINSTTENQTYTTAYGNTNTPNTIKSKDLNSSANAINQGQQSTNQGVQNTDVGQKGNAENDNSLETEPAKKNIFAKRTKKNGYFDTQNEVPYPAISKTRGRRNATRKAAAQSMNDEFVVNNNEKSSSRGGANMSPPGQNVQSIGENVRAVTSENSTQLNYNLLQSRQLRLDSNTKWSRPKKQDFAYFKPQKLEKSKAKLSLADAYLRTGLVGTIGKGMLNYGLNTELFLDQRISLSLGLAQQIKKGDYYLSETHYMDKKHENFKDKYKPKLPPAREVLNIHEQSDMLIMPIRLSYNHPVGNNTKLILGLGTDLDLKAKQRFDYEYSYAAVLAGNGPTMLVSEYREGSFYNDFDLKKLNNVALALGVEQRFGKLGLQAKVTEISTFRQVDYRKKNSLNGQLGLFWSL